jgi:hypothetical protein
MNYRLIMVVLEYCPQTTPSISSALQVSDWEKELGLASASVSAETFEREW